MATLMLGVSGCRGIVGDSLTPETCARFSGSFGSWLVHHAQAPATVVLARDGRKGGEVVYHAAIAGLIGAGCDVVDIGVCTTPTAAVAVDHHAVGRPSLKGKVAGMVLTASHNPQQWNGLKCLLPDGRGLCGSSAAAPPADVAAAIVQRFQTGQVGAVPWDRVGAHKRDEGAADVHIERVLSAVADAGLSDAPRHLGHGLSVVVDSVNASGVRAAADLGDALGCEEFLHLGCEESGLFPHPPEPTLENLSALCSTVQEAGAQVGFAQDPDADRLALVDEQGDYVGEEYTLALCALGILEAEKRAGRDGPHVLVTNLSTSRMLEDIAARFNARVVRTAVGEANVVDAMKREGALLGGEGNGGLIWPRTTYVRDSLASIAVILAMLEHGRRSLSELVRTIPRYAIVKRKVDLASKDAARPAVERLAAHYRSQRVDLQDGVRVDFDHLNGGGQGWLHVRASNTEPIMRLIAEAPTRAQAEALLNDAAGAIA